MNRPGLNRELSRELSERLNELGFPLSATKDEEIREGLYGFFTGDLILVVRDVGDEVSITFIKTK